MVKYSVNKAEFRNVNCKCNSVKKDYRGSLTYAVFTTADPTTADPNTTDPTTAIFGICMCKWGIFSSAEEPYSPPNANYV